jgi:AhpD family alkylhydroperoxidase
MTPTTSRKNKPAAGRVKEILLKRADNRKWLEGEAPALFHGFDGLMKEYYRAGALDIKNKELIAVALSVASRCVPCLANHANKAVRAGAGRQEVLEAAAIGVEFGGGPSLVIVRNNLLEFLDEIEAEGPGSL